MSAEKITGYTTPDIAWPKKKTRKGGTAGAHCAESTGSLSDEQLAQRTHRRVLRAMRFPKNTDPYSRHVRMMGEALMRGRKYPMFEEEPGHCAQSLLVTVEMLWKLRTKLERLEARANT